MEKWTNELQFTHQVPVWPLRFFNEFAGHHVASDANAGGGQKQNATELSCGKECEFKGIKIAENPCVEDFSLKEILGNSDISPFPSFPHILQPSV